MPAPPTVTPAQLHHALLLLARQQGGTPAVAAAACEALSCWRAADPRHERAYQKALLAWNSTAADDLQEVVAPPPQTEPRRRQAARRALTAVLGLAALAVTRRWLPSPGDAAGIIITAQAAQRTVYFQDGTCVDVGAKTALRFVETARARQVFLASGDARFSVTKNPAKPFVVTSMFGAVTVIGTVFAVSVNPVRMNVAVSEGRVGVRADPRAMFDADRRSAHSDAPFGADGVLLTPGHAVDVDEKGLRPVHTIDTTSVGAWHNGRLEFDREELLSAIARWNDYTQDVIRVREHDRPGLQGLRLTGSFSFADEAAFLESLPRILPITLSRSGAYTWVKRR